MHMTGSLPFPKMSVNGASIIFDLALWIIQRQWQVGNPQWTHPQRSMARMLVMISGRPPTIERPQSINGLCGGSECYTATNCIVLFLHRVLNSQSLQSNLVYNFTNMHAMSYRSDFLTFSSGVHISEPAACFAVSLLSAVVWVGLPSCLIPAAM